MSYRTNDDEDGINSEIHQLFFELQRDAEQLNIAVDKSGADTEIKHMVAALADKIDGLASLM
ncbi:hypothetical protein IGS75_12230 [Gluconobacter sphaericus]|uniref:hypothetical protein n=1 Tax=Gluconobacter sphaericus TaxID=574987 RepID=UPI001922788E|nr:hypothetical protein [Gluconobacter sphaericus]QQX90896.1 hypothetical protein IGS75_12230 [Gluconobacter sphaericus]